MEINTYIIHKKELKSQCLSENMQFILIPGKLQTVLLCCIKNPYYYKMVVNANRGDCE